MMSEAELPLLLPTNFVACSGAFSMEPNTVVSSVKELLVATRATVGPKKVETGIFKISTDKPLKISDMGLEGDFQVDRRVHGGLEKAIHQFPREHYKILQEALPHLAEKLVPATIGENISAPGMNEDNVHIGDIYAIGTTLLQVSQPRRPCWKINHRYGNAHLSALIIMQGMSGWYYRVLETGVIQAGDTIRFMDRLESSAPIKKIWELFKRDKNGRHGTPELRTIPGLSKEWHGE